LCSADFCSEALAFATTSAFFVSALAVSTALAAAFLSSGVFAYSTAVAAAFLITFAAVLSALATFFSA